MTYRKFGKYYARINDELLTEYKNTFPQVNSDANNIVSYIIETRLIFRNIQNIEDMEDAKKYVKNMFYSGLSEWVDAQLRKDIMNHVSICKNCKMLSENSFCPILGAFVNPYQKSCHNMQTQECFVKK